jgi:hypothetical protein
MSDDHSLTIFTRPLGPEVAGPGQVANLVDDLHAVSTPPADVLNAAEQVTSRLRPADATIPPNKLAGGGSQNL